MTKAMKSNNKQAQPTLPRVKPKEHNQSHEEQ
jgi:hypothetical protein